MDIAMIFASDKGCDKMLLLNAFALDFQIS